MSILKKIIPAFLKKFILLLLKKVLFLFKRLKRFFFIPKILENQDGRVLLHLGCGEKSAPGWINIDLLPLPHIHYLQDVSDLTNFPIQTADLIYASHVLEHFSHLKTVAILKEWHRVLKTSGILRLSVPDFDRIIDIYQSENKNMSAIIQPLMGGQDYAYNFHQNMFNENYLTSLLKQAGFKEVRPWNPVTAPDHPFSDWSSKSITLAEKKYPISLNLEGIK